MTTETGQGGTILGVVSLRTRLVEFRLQVDDLIIRM